MIPLLRELAEATRPPCVSIYLPLEVGFEQAKRNATRWEHAVHEAVGRLRDARNGDEWQARLGAVDLRDIPLHDVKTLAVFLDAALLRQVKLAQPLPDQVAVAHTFTLRPLALALDFERPYNLLALSVNRVAFYEGDHRGLRPRPIAGLPGSMADALGSELTQGELQYHSVPAEGGELMVHGHGGARDERDVDLERFHRVVRRVLTDELKGSSVPLVLATDHTHNGPFRSGLKLHQLLPVGLTGNPDHLSPEELHTRAWPLIEDVVAGERRDAAAVFEEARGLGKAAIGLKDTVHAAVVGRVRRLWVAAEARVPGRIDMEAGRVVPNGGDDDALEELTAIVVRHAGDVIVASEATPMPAQAEVAAELRY